jgi:hypothetical protein
MAEAKLIEIYKDDWFLYEVKSINPGISFIQYKEFNRNSTLFRAYAELEEYSFQTDNEEEKLRAIAATKDYLDNRW